MPWISSQDHWTYSRACRVRLRNSPRLALQRPQIPLQPQTHQRQRQRHRKPNSITMPSPPRIRQHRQVRGSRGCKFLERYHYHACYHGPGYTVSRDFGISRFIVGKGWKESTAYSHYEVGWGELGCTDVVRWGEWVSNSPISPSLPLQFIPSMVVFCCYLHGAKFFFLGYQPTRWFGVFADRYLVLDEFMTVIMTIFHFTFLYLAISSIYILFHRLVEQERYISEWVDKDTFKRAFTQSHWAASMYVIPSQISPWIVHPGFHPPETQRYGMLTPFLALNRCKSPFPYGLVAVNKWRLNFHPRTSAPILSPARTDRGLDT